MPSFDVVSKVNLMELDNALNTALKEISQRYDFRGTNTHLERTPEGIILRSSDEQHLDPQTAEAAAGQSLRQLIKLKMGIEVEIGKKISKALKDSKIKVQGSIQGDEVRVTGKNKDDLQAAMALLRREDFGLDLQFVN